jgi:hypothetical protein
MGGSRSVRIPDHVLARAVDGELVLLNLDNENYYGLDEVGTAMWEAISTTASVGDALQELLGQFDVDEERLTADLDQLLGELSSRGLVELDPS